MVQTVLYPQRRPSDPSLDPLCRSESGPLLGEPLGGGGGAQRVYFFDYGAVPWTDYEEERWATAKAAVEDGIEFARERGVHLVFLYVPTKYRVYRDLLEIPQGSPLEDWSVWEALPVRFQELCASASIPCVDLTGPLRKGVREGRMAYAPSDTHWSPEGHSIVAAELEKLLNQRGW